MDQASKIGSVQIANNALALICALAATEVSGVYSLAGPIHHEDLTQVAERKIEKAVIINRTENGMDIDIHLIADGSLTLMELTERVTRHVEKTLEAMTGMEVHHISVYITGVRG